MVQHAEDNMVIVDSYEGRYGGGGNMTRVDILRFSTTEVVTVGILLTNYYCYHQQIRKLVDRQGESKNIP